MWALKRLDKITQIYDYKNTNMLSLMTLSVDHLHATSHIKYPIMTQLQYARDFMSTLKESIKRSKQKKNKRVKSKMDKITYSKS